MSEKVIFTALFGNYEDLKEPTVITPGWKYLCFTDQELKSNVWEIEKCPTQEHSQRQARMIKICYPSTQAQTIWIDASFKINVNLDGFWSHNYGGGITAPLHPVRRCVYREAEICRRRGLDESNVVKQIMRYSKEGMPQHNGLISSGILLRDNSQSVKDFCVSWWHEVSSGSLRDQISFAYCNWKNPIASYMNYDYRTRTEFQYFKHYHNR